MNKVLAVIIMSIMSATLMTIGLWNVMEDTRWLIITGIGLIGGLYASNEFSKMQFGEIEVEEDEEA